MSDNDQLDVLIAVYLIPDLARQDFDAYVELARTARSIRTASRSSTKDADGEVHVEETGDHLGRKGVKAGAGVGLVLGLFAPPLLAATAVGAAVGGLAGNSRATGAGGNRGEDGRRAPTGLGRHHRDLRPWPGRARRHDARQCDPEVDRADRQGVRQGAEGRARRGRGRPGGRLIVDVAAESTATAASSSSRARPRASAPPLRSTSPRTGFTSSPACGRAEDGEAIRAQAREKSDAGDHRRHR